VTRVTDDALLDLVSLFTGRVGQSVTVRVLVADGAGNPVDIAASVPPETEAIVYRARATAGLCGMCGEREKEPGSANCEECNG
jgi:hypothetical protein